jgi:hypothetical protein
VLRQVKPNVHFSYSKAWSLGTLLNFNFPFQHSMKFITSSFTVNYFHVAYNVCALFSTAFYYGVVSYCHGQEAKYKENEGEEIVGNPFPHSS